MHTCRRASCRGIAFHDERSGVEFAWVHVVGGPAVKTRGHAAW